jgi:hypothetical protein
MPNLSGQKNIYIYMKCQASSDSLACLPGLVLLATLVVLPYIIHENAIPSSDSSVALAICLVWSELHLNRVTAQLRKRTLEHLEAYCNSTGKASTG